jgi:site-specific DNA-cytosine methylase
MERVVFENRVDEPFRTFKDGCCGTIRTIDAGGGKHVLEVKVIGQMDNTIDHTFESANRVYDVGGVSPTLMAGEQDICRIENQYRIRKLTPLECWRLMDFTDEDFEKAAQVNSNTQLYRQAGNSICKNVLVAILGQMIPGKEDVYKKLETR